MELSKLVHQPNATMIDVREPFEYFFGHVSGSRNIPLGSIHSHLDEFKKMGKPIILYCKSGNRSGQAVAILKANGIKEAYNGGSVEEMKRLLKSKKAA